MSDGFELFTAILGLPSTFPQSLAAQPGVGLNGPFASASEYGNLVYASPTALATLAVGADVAQG